MLLLATTRAFPTPPREILPLLQRVLVILWVPDSGSIGLAERHSACRMPMPLGPEYRLLGRLIFGCIRSGEVEGSKVSDVLNYSTRLDNVWLLSATRI